MAATKDLKSFGEIRAGSSPAFRINLALVY